MQITGVENLGFSVPEVAVFNVDEVPKTHQEWSEALGELDLGNIFGGLAVNATLTPYAEVGYTMERSADGQQTRDWWAGDHFWHVDGTRWPQQPVLTGIVCEYADPSAPATEILDTARLLDISLDDGFWKSFGLTPDDLRALKSVFVDSTYQREAIPFLRQWTSHWEESRLDDIIQADLDEAGVDTLEELLEKTDQEYPPKEFDLIQRSPLSGREALFLDAGGRNSKLVAPDGTDYTQALRLFRFSYLSHNAPHRSGISRAVSWGPNKGVIFPQRGTLHRALPGNSHNRRLHLGFLIEEPTDTTS